jgi:hypothetical protein
LELTALLRLQLTQTAPSGLTTITLNQLQVLIVYHVLLIITALYVASLLHQSSSAVMDSNAPVELCLHTLTLHKVVISAMLVTTVQDNP